MMKKSLFKSIVSLMVTGVLVSPIISVNAEESAFSQPNTELASQTKYVTKYYGSHRGNAIWVQEGNYQGYIYYRGTDNSHGVTLYVYSGSLRNAPAVPLRVVK